MDEKNSYYRLHLTHGWGQTDLYICAKYDVPLFVNHIIIYNPIEKG